MNWAVCATPEYLERHGTPEVPADLARHDFLMFLAVSNADRWTFTRGDQRSSVRVSGSFSSNNLLAIHAALRSSLGICAVSRRDFADDLAEGRVVEVLQEYELAPVQINVVYPPGHQDLPKVRFAVDFLADRWTDLD
jgi:DNA-binding transcriptional LysR family regulator